MTFQNKKLPKGLEKVGETPELTEETMFDGLKSKHMAPKGKIGFLKVLEGEVNFMWEDDPKNVLTANKDNPIVIEPERYHRVIPTKKVKFKVEFYKNPEIEKEVDKGASRPGEAFLK